MSLEDVSGPTYGTYAHFKATLSRNFYVEADTKL
jgi:hypothetical protein